MCRDDCPCVANHTTIQTECNSHCACAEACCFRTVQRGLSVRLEVFESLNKGFGLRTLQPISEGSFVISYIGELINVSEARRRLSYQDQHKLDNYIFVAKEHFRDRTVYTCVDPKYRGNAARFINHSCKSNLELRLARWSFVPVFALYATRDISTGEELSFSYGEPPSPVASSQARPCHCNAPNCLGHLPFDPTLKD